MSPPWPKSHCTSILISNIHSIEDKKNTYRKLPEPEPNWNICKFYLYYHLPFAVRHSLQQQNNSMFNVLKSKCYSTANSDNSQKEFTNRLDVVSFEGNSRFDVRHLCTNAESITFSHIFEKKDDQNLLIKIHTKLKRSQDTKGKKVAY